MEGTAKVLITAVGVNSQTGIIMSLLGASNGQDKKDNRSKKQKGKETLFLVISCEILLCQLTINYYDLNHHS